ncbi:MAG: carboxylating nicotinate-nucleotide diphosphorylase [Candidatus Obscuribacterales bacterium]|nr:carboxylating nicotinate-nucleotide diphosphorylase [Candidatus Obscuribacterales bacterium]
MAQTKCSLDLKFEGILTFSSNCWIVVSSILQEFIWDLAKIAKRCYTLVIVEKTIIELESHREGGIMVPALKNFEQLSGAAQIEQSRFYAEKLWPHVEALIDQSFAEDLASGDITSEGIVPAERISEAHLYIKEPAVVAGLAIFAHVLKRLDGTLLFESLVPEATVISETPYLIANIKGSSRALLAGERTALNILQRLSGIATLTARFVELAKPYGISILDTRKTTPGLRMLEKWAVMTGGGTNHRFGLYDQILIKDNHIRVAGSVSEAVKRARAYKPGMPVEVEVASFEQLEEALLLKVERIMLDNMTSEQVKQAVTQIKGAAMVEVSGGINLSNLTQYLIPGVDAISIGALTHSVKNVDISLEIED